MTPKQKRAQTIAQCLQAIADYYGADARKIITHIQVKGQASRDARNVFVYHLHRCGMCWSDIARIVQRSYDGVRNMERNGAIRMMGEDRLMIESLPKVDCGKGVAA